MPRFRAGFALLVSGIAIASLAADPGNPASREFEVAARTILCDCGCHPQSVYDCACSRAAEMREEIAAAIESGKTGLEVIDAYVARHGEQIRIAPVASGFSLLAWLGPGFALLLGVLGILLLVRRWRRSSVHREAGSRKATPAADDPYVARVEQQIRDHS